MTENPTNKDFNQPSFIHGHNAAYLEALQTRYSSDRHSVGIEWHRFFENFDDLKEDIDQRLNKPSWASKDQKPIMLDPIVEELRENIAEDITHKLNFIASNLSDPISAEVIQRSVTDSVRALMLIRAYRILGHLVAEVDPLNMREMPLHPELEPSSYGFTETDLDRPIFLDNVLGLQTATINEILTLVKRTYCGTFALQYMHISNPNEASWLKERIEGFGKEILFTAAGRKAILNKIVEAEGFEKFLQIKYTGTKRFGLDGGESLIPAMEQIIKRGGALGIEEIIIGMPHRGRLSVLANVMAKPYHVILNEFQGGNSKPEYVDGSGDVKYHLGASSDREFDGNKVHLSLVANPSHLEAVNPVVLGKVRAKQDQIRDLKRDRVLPILIHGDAAFAGQGVVAEGFGLSGLKGHKTGGTIHIIVNNQIGFTTVPHFSRSSPYPTDIALMVQAPIFHVNGDDPEAVVHAAKVATEFRQKFHKDVVLDIICYRRFGHNEADEPMFTNPLMYNQIKNQETTLSLYANRLIKDKLVSVEEVEKMKIEFQTKMSTEQELGKGFKPNKADWLDGKWSHLKTNEGGYQPGNTAISKQTYDSVSKALTSHPENFKLHRTLVRLLDQKKKMLVSGESIDWATAEALSFGSLLLEGYPVRLSGQDSTRGTFSQRHASFVDQDSEDRYYPLTSIQPGQANFEVIDSMLSEYAVLGFEYGYSLAEPNSLVLWEAQFGDFANGAQIMFDQFISSGEAKWLRMSGLVMLLPHGYEGQGPEHSSARLERFLQMCGADNWIVANCSTPANYFHILRRQMHRPYRKPLVIMTPKSLLRHKLAVSNIKDFTKGSCFHRVLLDDAENDSSKIKLQKDSKIKRVVLCSGKIYYDLWDARQEKNITEIYLLRIEQLYPFPSIATLKELKRFKNAEIVWCQEEPKNQGAWTFIEPNIEEALIQIKARAKRPIFVGRCPSASPATGFLNQHKTEQSNLIDQALTLEDK